MGAFYINLFKTMEQENLLNVSNPVHIECLRYCFGDIIKEDILLTRKEWNEHRVRKQNNRNVEGGVPNVLFKCPEQFGTIDFRKPLNLEHIQHLIPYNSVSKPCTTEDAYNLFLQLTDAIRKL